MIFIEAQGRYKTDMEVILSVLDCIPFTTVHKCKARNAKDKLQVLFKDETAKAVCFVNFCSGNKRKDFIELVEREFGLVETEEESPRAESEE